MKRGCIKYSTTYLPSQVKGLLWCRSHASCMGVNYLSMSIWLFQFYFFCIGWYEFKHDFNLVISTNNDKMRLFTAMTWYGITHGHQMSWGYIRPNVSMTRNLTKCQPGPKPDLLVEGYMWCLFYTHLKRWRLISLFILLFFTYFCLGILGID